MGGVRQTMVLMAGYPGAGKSTLALAVGAVLGWPVIDKDVFKALLLERGLPESSAGPLAYDLMFATAADLQHQGQSVILDSPLGHRVTWEAACRLAGGLPLKVVLCEAEAPTRDRRMRQRPPRISQPSSLSAPGGNPSWSFDHLPPGTLALETSRPLVELVRTVVSYLRKD